MWQGRERRPGGGSNVTPDHDSDAILASYAASRRFTLGRPRDLVIALSGSGNSENVIRAVQYANENDAVTLGLCGYDGGRLKNAAQHVLWTRVSDMQLSEDVHAIFGHIVMQRLCGYL